MKELLFIALTILMLAVWFKYFLYPFLKDDSHKHKISQFNEEERYTAVNRLIDDYWESYNQNHRPIWGHPIDRKVVERAARGAIDAAEDCSIETLSQSASLLTKTAQQNLTVIDPTALPEHWSIGDDGEIIDLGAKQ